MNKEELRNSSKLNIQALPVEDKLKAQQKAVSFLKENYLSYDNIGSFCPLADELDFSEFNYILAQKKKLALPRVENNELHFYQVLSIESETQYSKYKILEPVPSRCKKLESSSLSLLIVPGLAFNLNGTRLGRGLGFYDKFLSKYSGFRTISIIFEIQVHKNPIPTEPHDQRVENVYSF